MLNSKQASKARATNQKSSNPVNLLMLADFSMLNGRAQTVKLLAVKVCNAVLLIHKI